MRKTYQHSLSLVLVPTLVFAFFVISTFTNSLSAYAATRSVQNSSIANDIGGECAPATTYNWYYTGRASNIKFNGKVVLALAEATNHATFRFDGRCGTPVVTFNSCTAAPPMTVAANPSCYWYNTGDTDKSVYTEGDNDVIYQGFTLCTLSVRLGSDEEGYLLEDTYGTNC